MILYTINHAIVRGIIEKNDGSFFFGSKVSYPFHLKEAVREGFVSKNETGVTEKGRDLYNKDIKNKNLPECSWFLWRAE